MPGFVRHYIKSIWLTAFCLAGFVISLLGLRVIVGEPIFIFAGHVLHAPFNEAVFNQPFNVVLVMMGLVGSPVLWILGMKRIWSGEPVRRFDRPGMTAQVVLATEGEG
jgi:hypothetical protein